MTYYAWFVVFVVAAYLILSDNSIAAAFSHIFDIVKNRIIREIWWLKNNPDNPVVKYLMWRRSMKLAKELQDELKSKHE